MLMTLVAAAEEKATLFLPNWAFPLIAAIVFLLLALVVWSYRNVANRHADATGGNTRGEHAEPGGGGHR
ncbi:MAG: hypothetical protein HY996_08680 [Micrococcales bacterium]|nr:hypothetical protein [Micrococcales bacterium]